MNKCNQCPRHCDIDRAVSSGFCGGGADIEISKTMRHFWEEPLIADSRGSGAIFFTHCNLQCIYCQNYDISHDAHGQAYSPSELAECMADFERQGVANIDLVTPSHYVDKIIQALDIYRPHIPVVWNTGGYDSVDTIRRLKGYVDIFLIDFKYFSDDLAREYSHCADYFDICTSALLEIQRLYPVVTENGLMKQGFIIRHLVLPSHSDDSIRILDWIAEHLGTDTYISLMSQYTPYGTAVHHPVLSRKVKNIEYKKVLLHARRLGFHNGCSQALSSASECFIPDFHDK